MPTKKAPRSPKVKFTNRGKRLTQSQLWQVVDLLTAGADLPPDFEEFLLTYNGGDPDPAYFDWKHPKEGKTRSHVDSLLGIDLEPLDVRNADCVRVAMWHRTDLPRFAFPFGFADRDNLLGRVDNVWAVLVKGGPRLTPRRVSYGAPPRDLGRTMGAHRTAAPRPAG